MKQFSQELRQSVYKALLCAQSAASMQQTLSKLQGEPADGIASDRMSLIAEAAYTAAAHAWTAMIALVSHNPNIAQKAAQAAADAENTIMTISQELLPIGSHVPDRQHCLEQPPDEKDLHQLWGEFCRSLPSPYPVPESLDAGSWDISSKTN